MRCFWLLLTLFSLSCYTPPNLAPYKETLISDYNIKLLGNNTPNAPSSVDTKKALDVITDKCVEFYSNKPKCLEVVKMVSHIKWWGVISISKSTGLATTVVVLNGKTYSGITFPTPPIRMHVAWRGAIHRSALAHEFFHLFNGYINGDFDYDHKIKSLWEKVDNTKKALLSLNL